MRPGSRTHVPDAREESRSARAIWWLCPSPIPTCAATGTGGAGSRSNAPDAPGDSAGVRQPAHLDAVGSQTDGHQVDAPDRWSQPPGRGSYQPSLFLRERLNRILRGASLHLDRDQLCAKPNEEVDLAGADPEIAAEDSPTPGHEKFDRYLLAKASKSSIG